MKWLARLLCVIGEHELHAAADAYTMETGAGRVTPAPPVGHPCRPEPGDSEEIALHKFSEWTRRRCRRCDFKYPAVTEWPKRPV